MLNSYEDTKNRIYNNNYLQICLPTILFFRKKGQNI